jgi:CHASE3 domain sensor protein
MYKNLENYTEEVELVRHSGNIIQSTQLVLSYMKDAETGSRGYQLSGDTVFLKPYNWAIALLPDELKKLDSLVSQNEGQKAEGDSLRILVQEQFIIFSNINANVKRESLYMDRYETLLLARSRVHMDAIRAHIAEILAEEEKVAELRSDYEISYKILTPISLLFYTVLALVGVVFLFTRILLALDKSKEAEFLLSVNLEKQRLQLEIIEERKIILDEAEAIAEMGSWKWVEREDEMVWSSGLYAILDKKTDQDVSLNTFLENVIPEDTQEVERFFLEMKSKEENSTIEYRILQNNQLRYLSVTARPKSNLDKDENIVLGVVLDITENKLHEKQQHQYNAELRRSNEDQEQYANEASHD